MQVDRVLVPLDGSPLAEAALTWAASLTRAGGTVVLLRAAEAPTARTGDPIETQLEAVRAAEAYLAGVVPAVTALGVSHVDTAVWYGPAVESIVDAARYRNAELIVMSTHGRSGLGRLVMGSVAESVLRSTTTPILLVRSPQAAGAAAIPAATESEAVR
ncbi:MAG: universal stress protein [Candidatus Rokuibacteriota bacterium]